MVCVVGECTSERGEGEGGGGGGGEEAEDVSILVSMS